jgi:ATP-binding cassette, subfamily B, bacterial MsbA
MSRSIAAAEMPKGNVVPMNVYKRLFMLVIPYRNRLILAMVCMLGVAACTSASAYLIKPVLDDVFVNKKMDMLRILPLLVLALFVVKGVCSCGNSYLMSYVGEQIISQTRQKIYDHLQSLSLSFFDHTPTGSLMSRIMSDVAQMQNAVTSLSTGLVKDLFSIIGLLGVIIYQDLRLALISLVILPFAFFPIVKCGKMLRRYSTRRQESMGDLSVMLHETLGGQRIVKAFCMEEYEKQRFNKVNMKYLKYRMKAVLVRSLATPIMELMGGLGIVTIIWYGGYSVIQGESTPGRFFSFLAALIMLYEPVKRLSATNNTIQDGVAASIRVYDILDTPPQITDAPDAVELQPIRESIELRHVHFSYQNEPVLTDINLKVAAGEIVAIVGMSGAGKTTLVNLIPRFYEMTSGAILIDGVDIRSITLASLRSQIGMVTQQTILFNETVRNNIAYGDINKSENDIIAAAKAANAYDFIMKMPKGFDTVVGEQGVRLSGGERQRICIARALLKDAPILILDEATSSLDSDSETEVQKALENLMAGRTTLVIAHRLSTIKNADRIISMSAGRIAEEGRHDDLLKTDTEYRRLYELQFSQFEYARAS